MPISKEAIATFGTGDIIVSVAKWGNGPIDTVAFKENSEGHVVGEKLLPESDPISSDDFDMFLRFTNPDSVDVVMEALQLVKEYLIEDAEG